MTAFIDIALLALLALTGLAVLRLRNLFAAVILTGIYSLLSAGLFVAMDAPDVAFTESAVGVGVATVLFLAALTLVGHEERPPRRTSYLPLGVVILTGAILVYGMLDVPPYGNPDNPVHQHVVPRYLVDSREEVDVDNVVSAVLATYRGYDTMGETTVIFAAGVGVLLLLGTRRRRASGATERSDDE